MTMEENRILDLQPELSLKTKMNKVLGYSLLAGLFAVLETPLAWLAGMVFLPAILISRLLGTLVAVTHWQRSYNKNFFRTARALMELITLATVGIAVIGTLAGSVLFTVLTPLLLTGAVGVNVIYHAVKIVGLVLQKNSAEEYTIHRQKLYRAVAATLTGCALLIATVLLVMQLATGVFAITAAISAAAVSSISALWCVARAYQLSSQGINRPMTPSIEEDNKPFEISMFVFDSNPERKQKVMHAKLTHSEMIAELQLQSPGTQVQFIETIITNKIFTLRHQIGTEFFQSGKRQNKIAALLALQELLHDNLVYLDGVEPINTIAALLDYFDSKKISNSVFGSFFRETGEMQKIFLLMDAYLHAKQTRPTRTPDDLPHYTSMRKSL
jgi:hypothetical protein